MLTKAEQQVLKAIEDFSERYPAESRIHWSPNRTNCVLAITIHDHHGYNLYASFEPYATYDERVAYFIRGELTIKRIADKKGLAIWTTGHHQTVEAALVEIKEKWDRLWADPEMESKFTESKFTEFMFLLED